MSHGAARRDLSADRLTVTQRPGVVTDPETVGAVSNNISEVRHAAPAHPPRLEAALGPVVVPSDGLPADIAPCSARGYRCIVWIMLLYGAIVSALVPFANMAGPEWPSVTPFFVAAVLVTELSTSFLLFVWTRSVRTWSLLVLASTYLYGSVMSVFHLLTFRGAVVPDVAILGRPPQSTAWAFNLWFSGYAILALIAILLEIRAPRISAAHVDRAIGLAVAAVASAILILVMLATTGIDWLPPLMANSAWNDLFKTLVAADLVILLTGIGLVMLVIGRRNVIFLLLALVLTALAFNQVLSLSGPARWTLGWYAGRLTWFISACILFLFFMVQFARQQTSLARSREVLEARVAERTVELTSSVEQRDLLLREVREKTAAIQRDTDLFHSIMATMVEALLLIDMDCNIIYQNSAACALLHSPAAAARPGGPGDYEAFQLDGTTPLPVEERPSRRCLRGEIIDEFELLFRPRGSLKLKHLLGSARPIRDPTGRQTGAVMVFRDVTEAKEIEHQLHQSQKLDAIGQLTGGVAHDFNNILTVIAGAAGSLAEQPLDQSGLRDIAGMIGQATDRGAELTRQLLAVARKQPLLPRSVDVNRLVCEAVQLLRATLGEQVEIGTALADDVELAHVDPSQLSTALLNLAVNARDAMPDGGNLAFESRNVALDDGFAEGKAGVQPGRYVMIAVCDTGTGIPASLRDKVFEPFFTTKAFGKGTGLGLSMVYGFVKQSGGHITVHSEEGRGTAIRLYLPCSTEQLEAVAVAAPPMVGGAETILVVEDDELLRNSVVAQLQSLGYSTLTANGGVAALALVNAGSRFDLLFTDVIMPGGINGRQLADEVARRRPSVKILFSSGYTENAMVHQGQSDPELLLLQKPYRKADLARMVRMALNNRLDAEDPGADALAQTGTG